MEVGPYKQLQRKAERTVELDGALLPQLINCHSHLELAGYGETMQTMQPQSSAVTFPEWIRKLLQLRSEAGKDPEARKGAAVNLFRQMADEGVGGVLDTGNLEESEELAATVPVEHHFLLEMLGFSAEAASLKIAELEGMAAKWSVTAHAPYSTHSALLQKIKARCKSHNQLFSVHTAESREEREFLLAGSGAFVDFLKERGVLDGGYQAPGCSTVEYFNRLGLLDQGTLCVHCVQVTEDDIAKLVGSGSAVCLCPGSNRTLGVGIAPVQQMIEAGVRLCLGTDSLASNPHCSMWREMQILGEEHPGLAPERILALATIGGAGVLGVEERLGSLEAGKRARMVLVRGHFADQRQLSEALVGGGQELEAEPVRINYA